MNEEIAVSVLCLAYNHEKYIRQCLDSIVMQKTNFNFEVIVHDDASTDSTADIIKEYEEKYPDIIKPIYQKENQYSQGVKILSKILYPITKGKFIAFCDGDDSWCDENKLQKQHDAMIQHLQCSICVHKIRVMYENGIIDQNRFTKQNLHFYPGIQDKSYISNLIWDGQYPFQTSCYFIRRDVILELMKLSKTDFSLMNGDDRILRISNLLGDFYYIDTPMSCYRVASSNSWTTQQKRIDIKVKINKLHDYIKACLAFHLYSNFTYESYVCQAIAKTIINIVHLDPKNTDILQYKPYMKIAIKDKKYSKKQRLKFAVWYYTPWLFYFIDKLKKTGK